MPRRPHFGMGVLMHHQPQPVRPHHPPHINQNGNRTQLQIAKAVNSVSGSQGSGKDLDGWPLVGVETVLAGGEVAIELGVERVYVAANPGADRQMVLEAIAWQIAIPLVN